MNDGEHQAVKLTVGAVCVAVVGSGVGCSIVVAGVSGGAGAGSAHTSSSHVVLGVVDGVSGGVGAGSAHTSFSLDVAVTGVGGAVGVDLSAGSAVVVRMNPYLNGVDSVILDMSVLSSAVVVLSLKVVVVGAVLSVVMVKISATTLLARVIDLVYTVILALHLSHLLRSLTC